MIISVIIYLLNITWPDIAYTTRQLACMRAKPNIYPLSIAKGLL